MGTGSVIPGFEAGILNSKLNEEKVIAMTPEEGYTDPSNPLFGQTLHFKIKVIETR